jgi:hypothetical protein
MYWFTHCVIAYLFSIINNIYYSKNCYIKFICWRSSLTFISCQNWECMSFTSMSFICCLDVMLVQTTTSCIILLFITLTEWHSWVVSTYALCSWCPRSWPKEQLSWVKIFMYLCVCVHSPKKKKQPVSVYYCRCAFVPQILQSIN